MRRKLQVVVLNMERGTYGRALMHKETPLKWREYYLPSITLVGSALLLYDTVLFLDSNAMIVQLDYDVLDLIAQDKLLAMVGDTSSQT